MSKLTDTPTQKWIRICWTEDSKMITVYWPAGSKASVISGQWKRLADGRIEATYTLDEFRICMSIYKDLVKS